MGGLYYVLYFILFLYPFFNPIIDFLYNSLPVPSPGHIPLVKKSEENRSLSYKSGCQDVEGRGTVLIRFCLGAAAGLRPAVTNVSPLECLQMS